MTEVQRFWSYVEKSDDCWLWRGGVGSAGYGAFSVGSRSDGSLHQVGAHRYSYELAGGFIPDGYHIDHLCRVPRCVRPDHLEAVTPRTNTLRGIGPSARFAQATHCVHGHPFDEVNTWWDARRGTRQCRRCNTLRARARRRLERTAPEGEA